MKAQNVRVTVCVFVCLKVQSRQSRKSEWKFSEKSASVWAAHFIYSTGGMSEMGKKNNINRNTKNIFKFTNCNRTLKLKDASCCSSDFLISSTKQTPTHHSFKVNRRSVSYACFYICRLLDFFFFSFIFNSVNKCGAYCKLLDLFIISPVSLVLIWSDAVHDSAAFNREELVDTIIYNLRDIYRINVESMVQSEWLKRTKPRLLCQQKEQYKIYHFISNITC